MTLDRMKLRVRGRERDFYYRRNSSDSRVINQIFDANNYDLGRLRRFTDIIKYLSHSRSSGRRPLIVDGGANIGASSTYFASKFPDALVIAIEAAFDNYQLLVENSKGLRIHALHCALAATTNRMSVVDVGEGFWGYRTRPLVHGEKGGIRSITMNQIYEAYSAEYFPFIAKIDIEGGEKNLFESRVQWVRKTPLIIIELHDWLLPNERSSLPFLKCIASLDRNFVYIGEDVYSIANDLDQLVPNVQQQAGKTEHSTKRTGRMLHTRIDDQIISGSMSNSEEPLDDKLLEAARDFQADILVLQRSEDELRATLANLDSEKAQLQRAFSDEHLALQDASRALADSRRELDQTQQELADAQRKRAGTEQELADAQRKLAGTEQELADAQRKLAGTEQELADTQRKLAGTEQELAHAQRKLAGAEQELASVHQREKILVRELSLGLNSLQEMREQLHERDRELASARAQLEIRALVENEPRVLKQHVIRGRPVNLAGRKLVQQILAGIKPAWFRLRTFLLSWIHKRGKSMPPKEQQ